MHYTRLGFLFNIQTKLKLQKREEKEKKEKPHEMLFDCVNPALELDFLPLNGEDGEWTEAELDAERDREPAWHSKTRLGQHSPTTQGWIPMT